VAGKKNRKKRWLITIVILFIVAGLGGAGYFYYRTGALNKKGVATREGQEVCRDIFNPSCWTESFKPQLKQENGYTNALIVGLDTRSTSSGLLNTDSIILISFNHETEETMLISIPRDLHVPKYGKINAVYAFSKNKNPDDPFFYLKEVVTQITGQPIHYFATIKFDGVTDGIDEIGGVEVCPEKSFTAKYPNEKAKGSDPNQWLYFDFPAGCQSLNGEMALVYARFRHVTKGDMSLASDFSRARRQQEVIEAAKDKILAQELTLQERVTLYTSLANTYSKSVTIQNYTPEDILAALSYMDTADRDPINIVLDPNFGGLNKFIYTDGSSGIYYIKARDASWGKIKEEIANIWLHSAFYRDSPALLVRNMSGGDLAAETEVMKLKAEGDYARMFTVVKETADSKLPRYLIWDYTGEKENSMEYIKKYLGDNVVVADPATYGYTQSSKKEDIVIFVGPVPVEPTATVAPSVEPSV
jgi:LCP family protein required for cell wall assembly